MKGKCHSARRHLAIDTEASHAQLAAILDRTAMFWQLAGEVLPYQSVLTCDEYRAENFPAAEDAFYLTSQQPEDSSSASSSAAVSGGYRMARASIPGGGRDRHLAVAPSAC